MYTTATNDKRCAVPDKYRNFAELSKGETEGAHYRMHLREHAGTVAIIAPHGGGIEPGTLEIADAIAGADLSFYGFEGIKDTGNGELHITSTRFDEPQCIALVGGSPKVIAIHGEDSAEEIVFLGGRDVELMKRLRVSLTEAGFRVETHPNPDLQGWNYSNICNRGRTGCGIQLELSNGLRRTFFQSLTREGRKTKTPRFHAFVAAVRAALVNSAKA
jgi:phage replication-related protein YjqB (UPF0714/DUF867 family)